MGIRYAGIGSGRRSGWRGPSRSWGVLQAAVFQLGGAPYVTAPWAIAETEEAVKPYGGGI